MKQFFQGLVLGALLMYGYLNSGTKFLQPLFDWLSGAGNSYRGTQVEEELK